MGPLLAALEEALGLDDESALGVVEHVIAGAFYALECSRSADAGQAELVQEILSSIAWILAFVTANLFQGDGISDELAQLRAFIERGVGE
ncbi:MULTISPECIES: hypothetical protein [Streptomyces]|uniref:TetR family transcriptional regulator n=1 Tax=Streptomyces sp. NBC_00093 TaxID=2975649 RepID=A0AAU2A944_9ACTN